MSRTYLCVSIDTECDSGPAWKSRPPTFEGVRVGIVERLHPLFTSFGAKPTYLVSSDVLRNARATEELRAISPSCELGAHLDCRALEHAADDDQGAEKRRLTELTDQFIRAFEFQPLSFRTGVNGLGRRTIGYLEDLGYAVESSVTPNVNATGKEIELSFMRAPTQPYRVDRENPSLRGDSKILEVPITVRRTWSGRLPSLIGKRFAPRWLRPTFLREDALVRLAEDEIIDARRAAPERPVILNALLDANEVVPAASPHASFESDARRTLDRLRALLAFAQRESIAVVGLGDIPEILAS